MPKQGKRPRTGNEIFFVPPDTQYQLAQTEFADVVTTWIQENLAERFGERVEKPTSDAGEVELLGHRGVQAAILADKHMALTLREGAGCRAQGIRLCGGEDPKVGCQGGEGCWCKHNRIFLSPVKRPLKRGERGPPPYHLGFVSYNANKTMVATPASGDAVLTVKVALGTKTFTRYTPLYLWNRILIFVVLFFN